MVNNLVWVHTCEALTPKHLSVLNTLVQIHYQKLHTMSKPLCGDTIVGLTAVALILLTLLPLYPTFVLAFESGLLVGVFLHSSHTSHLSGLTDRQSVVVTDGGEDQENL